jgi:hypothetical protein
MIVLLLPKKIAPFRYHLRKSNVTVACSSQVSLPALGRIAL